MQAVVFRLDTSTDTWIQEAWLKDSSTNAPHVSLGPAYTSADIHAGSSEVFAILGGFKYKRESTLEPAPLAPSSLNPSLN